jgi:hypothetical protein
MSICLRVYLIHMYETNGECLFTDGSRSEVCRFDSCHSVNISSLEVDRKYPIINAERIGTRHGPTIILSLRDSPSRIIKVFVPRRYYSSFSDTAIEEINSATVALCLIFKGQCVDTKAYKLAIEKQQKKERNGVF